MELREIGFSSDLDAGFYMFVDSTELSERSLFARSAPQLQFQGGFTPRKLFLDRLELVFKLTHLYLLLSLDSAWKLSCAPAAASCHDDVSQSEMLLLSFI